MIQQRKRITWIDMAKGYGIIFVVLAHCGVGEFGRWIYTFHMPLFFLLSGYVFNSNCDFITFLKKKRKSMIIPYFCLGIPMLLFSGLVHYVNGDYTIRDYVFLFLRFVIQRRMWTLWFLACLFFLNIMFYLTQKVLKTNTKLAVFSILSIIMI